MATTTQVEQLIIHGTGPQLYRTGSQMVGVIPTGSVTFTVDLTDNGSDGPTSTVRVDMLDVFGSVVASAFTVTGRGTTAVTLGPITILPTWDRMELFYSNGIGLVTNVDMTVTVTWIGTFTYCQYGTRLQTGIANSIIVDAGLITALLSRVGMAPLTALFDTFIGLILYPGNVCNGSPPAAPTFTPCELDPTCGLFTAGTWSKLQQSFLAAQWFTWCECSPATGGGPAPVAYPDPVIGLPTPPPVAPLPIVCDNGDICSMLDELSRGLKAVALETHVVRQQLSLVQRQHVPFATAHGTRHTGLSGAGTITVSEILGLSVVTTAMPGYLSSDVEPVASWFRLGEISFGTADGWTRRQLVTHNPHLILDIGGDVTEVAYAFEHGVTADILELRRIP